jgi:UDPglucose 6-dehydrogenase
MASPNRPRESWQVSKPTIAVIGDWHNAWVTAACLASLGHDVTLVSESERLSVYEPGLDEMIAKARDAQLFHRCSPDKLWSAKYGWIALDTPLDESDRPDTAPVMAAALKAAERTRSLIVSSQVPLGFCQEVEKKTGLDVAYVPENMRLGDGIRTFLQPDRLIVGASAAGYASIIAHHLLEGVHVEPLLTDLPTAEMAKHATNAYLATQISLANELASIGQHYGVDTDIVAKALKLDPRIGPKAYVKPGMGFSGGTLPRDLRVLQRLALRAELASFIIDETLAVNERVFKEVARQACNRLGAETILLLGYSYKADIDTLRRSPAISTAREIRALSSGKEIIGFDPVMNDRDLSEIGNLITHRHVFPQAADVAVVLTPRAAFKGLNWKSLQGCKLVLDCCDGADASAVLSAGIPYKKLWGKVQQP